MSVFLFISTSSRVNCEAVTIHIRKKPLRRWLSWQLGRPSLHWREFYLDPNSVLNSCNLNSCNSKNHLNRTNFWVLWTYFSSCNTNFGFGVKFFHPSIFYCSMFKCFNSNAIILECFETFKFVWIQLLVADAIKMATKGKHHEVNLKVKYEALK